MRYNVAYRWVTVNAQDESDAVTRSLNYAGDLDFRASDSHAIQADLKASTPTHLTGAYLIRLERTGLHKDEDGQDDDDDDEEAPFIPGVTREFESSYYVMKSSFYAETVWDHPDIPDSPFFVSLKKSLDVQKELSAVLNEKNTRPPTEVKRPRI